MDLLHNRIWELLLRSKEYGRQYFRWTQFGVVSLRSEMNEVCNTIRYILMIRV